MDKNRPPKSLKSPLTILLLSRDYRRASAWTFEHLCDEIASQHHVARSRGAPGETNVEKLIGGDDSPRFDCVLACHLQFTKGWSGIDKAREHGIPTACIVNDYFPRHYDYKDEIVRRHQFDALLFSQRAFVDIARERQSAGHLPSHTRMEWLPFSVDGSIYYQYPSGNIELERVYDVTAIMSGHPFEYPNRPAAFGALHNFKINNPNYSCMFKFVDNPNGLEYSGDGIYHQAYVDILKRSKIVIGSVDQHGSCNIRNFEACATGAMLLTDGPPNDFEALGWQDGVSYVGYRDCVDLIDKVRYYADPARQDERERIAWAGWNLVAKRHNNVVRVRELTDMVRGLIGATD